ncbi:MAG: CRISPR-associated helicase Cas3' [Anaerolineales bacterium]
MDLWVLWGKTSKDEAGNTITHPLLCHMIDVAEVAGALWDLSLGEGLRRHIADALGCNEDDARQTLMFWAALHDLGKASPAFQRQYRPSQQSLEALGLEFPRMPRAIPCHHGAISAWACKPLLESFGYPSSWVSAIAAAVGGHHGAWPDAREIGTYAAPLQRGDDKWQGVREMLFAAVHELYSVPVPNLSESRVESRNGLLAIVSGVVSVADWIGSMIPPFTACPTATCIEEYAATSAGKASQALGSLGFARCAVPRSTVSMKELCSLNELRPLQLAISEVATGMPEPGLVLIEAPTGVGKTEAALYLADYWSCLLQQSGMYVAMPTMATSNAMYPRVGEVLRRRYADTSLNYQLLHGDALLTPRDMVPTIGRIGDDERHGRVGAQEWFTKRKRGLLAQFAVGTVDQALLSVLQTKHFFIRLWGLSHKTIIFDEVHAYDTYMEQLFFLLLRWLATLDATVIVLSATLPTDTRSRIMEAYVGHPVSLPLVDYPSITWSEGDTARRLHVEHEDRTPIALKLIDRKPATIVSCLREVLRHGGCAAVICNTVGRAQDVYREIAAAGLVTDGNLTLFHARFPKARRAAIEESVVNRYGRSPRVDGGPSIVVATQVIEQSLDLDFDVMVSDLAPVDLVIQRAGRLHRHPDRDQRGERPVGLSSPVLYLAMPDSTDDQVEFDRRDVHVYARYILLRSYLILRNRSSLELPRETESLVEDVYGSEERLMPLSESMLQQLADARSAMQRERREMEFEAARRLIATPDRNDLFEEGTAGLEEDDPELSDFMRAATRLSPPSITLVCLRGSLTAAHVETSGGGVTVNLTQTITHDLVIALANQRVESSDYRLVKHFVAQDPPSGWRKNAFLRYARPVFFDENGRYAPEEETWQLILDNQLGLYVAEKEGA